MPRIPEVGNQYNSRVAKTSTPIYYNYHRDYDPQTGRYIQSDPIGLEGGLNTYGYVLANPVTKVDPLGLDTREKVEVVMAVGVVNALTARFSAGGAETSAENSGLPGPWNGPQDAYRHCVWSCLMTQVMGADAAKKVGDAHERAGNREHHQKQSEEDMDQENNAQGRLCGVEKNSKTCQYSCMEKYKAGGLFGPGGEPMPGPRKK